MLNIAQKPAWWFILCLIPLVNIVIFIIIWMAIAEARHKPNWWGILMIVPVLRDVRPCLSRLVRVRSSRGPEEGIHAFPCAHCPSGPLIYF